MTRTLSKLPSETNAQEKLENLCGLFRNSRINAGLDLETLAGYSLVSVGTILQLETAPLKVRLEDIYAVANALNLDPGVVIDHLYSVNR